MNPLTQSKNTTILPVLIALTLGCFALSPQARAVAKKAAYTNDNTVLGDDALIRHHNRHQQHGHRCWSALCNTTGSFNTAIGRYALSSNTTGSSNTANGFHALLTTPPATTTRPPVQCAL